ncbi:hypothetical protein KAFR_0K00390 [Kazachstania africana CBS 2517]|uniref:DNA damage checkpoint protein 1 n=1 Tax=Kazachstania africana (strain ATCC 22294 / BCRC 22015 / CBS 2517 / CECT 1963 / NBRC 1671 / NRRL Y-8276) TaxID=1071382 RepID=H2B194_KAZAF|nr:hypothetical protein KAFR_0K00390 [Kazachstania africana CBS 2517]CCF60394.1 hypothetical protein KAFR_0K00390 [Kazachstania africana CBS 2517]
MSFRAVISNADKHNVWYRTVYMLSTINENIKMTITSSELIIWAMNSTDTTLSQIRFSKTFFDEYEFRPYEITFGEEGLQVTADLRGNDYKLYSIEIKGKHLTTISRKPDGDTVTKFIISINNGATCSEALINRLLVTVEMESLIKKEYSPQFAPIRYDPIVIDLKYKRKFLDVFGTSAETTNPEEILDPKLIAVFNDLEQELSLALFNDNVRSELRQHSQLSIEDEINYICCNQTLLKNFIENCNPNITETIKLEINTRKMIITAFMKKINGKDDVILKNALSMSNTISTVDLEHYCIFTVENEAPEGRSGAGRSKEGRKYVDFRLRDFRNFMNLLSSWKLQGNGGVNNINIWFCHPGDPILIEMSRAGVKMQLVQVTEASMVSSKNSMEGAIKKNTSPNPVRPASGNGNMQATNMSPLKSDMENHQDTRVNSRISPLKNVAPPIPVLRSNMPVELPVVRKLFVSENSQEDHEANNVPYTSIAGSIPSNAHEEPNDDNQHDAVDEQDFAIAGRHETTIGWGKRNSSEAFNDASDRVSEADRQMVLRREKAKYLRISDSGDGNEGSHDNDGNEAAQGLGPTQPFKPKGLFD